MAAANYTTELTSQEVFTDDTGTSFVLVSSGGGGQNSLTQPETDDYIQGSNSVSRNPFSSSARGMTIPITAQTITSGDAVWIWAKADVSKALETFASPADAEGAGVQVLIGGGSALNSLDRYYVDGSETYDLGGWRCYVVDPNNITPDVDNSQTSFTNFGVIWNVPADGPSKGFPFKIDAIRIGKFFTITDGDLANGYATFLGLSNTANADANRWGCFNFANGVYTMQGTMQLGSTTTAVDFRDSNRAIFIADTPKVNSTFNGIEVNQATSRVDWTNISISSLANTTYGSLATSKGSFVVNDNADINFESCTFVDMATFGFLSNSTVNATTFRGCGQITQSQAAITNCTISGSTATSAVLLDPTNAGSKFNNNDFTSSGTGHAIEITSGTSCDLSNITYSGYSGTPGQVSSTPDGNEAVYVNIGSGSYTLNITGGDSPSVRTAGATVTIEQSANITVEGLVAGSEVRFYVGTNPATNTEVAGVENSGTSFGPFSQSVAGQAGYYVIFALGYRDIYVDYTYKSTDDTIAVQQVIDRVYENPV